MDLKDPFGFREMLKDRTSNGWFGSQADMTNVELVALRTENARLKEENEQLRNTVLRCPCGKKLRIPVRKTDG